ncbi:uncharacterized protein LOC123534203 [Mercenaria mercenaria]|uniref:uncharacterized protein LOC123534203 n=1 Tax=Mercenaria mercenaria TaxID=6596 RepID=UPI00234F93C4|nr:uncharacterized protein LOC123534203 [Mercenaria mercenaria]XP_045172265.2 uncharacterized protein LOC123534203 [Mercenaria mercenaria]
MESSVFTYDEIHSKDYRWRDMTGKILFTIFSQTFPLGNADNSSVWKITEEDDEYGNLDVDVKALRQLTDENQKRFRVPVDFVYKPLLSFDEVKAYLETLDKEGEEAREGEETRKGEKYDCFFFVFLTYSTPEYANTFNEEKLHFNDRTLEKGIVPQAKILDEIKKLKVVVGKPKIFLIQADDLGLLGEKQYIKGPTFVPETVIMKIPQDADRLIIKSTIPQIIANLDETGFLRAATKRPSFLIQAFIETLLENNNRKLSEREDLFTLSTCINGKIARMVKESKHRRSGDMYVPLVTSTLTKSLYL